MKLYELKQIIKEEIYKELNEGIFSTIKDKIITCTLDDLQEKIEEICKNQFGSIKYELEKDVSKKKIEVEVNYGNYTSNDLTFIQSGQTDENIYKKLKERCNVDFKRFVPPLSKFCTGILKINRPSIIMYTQHGLPVKKIDEKTNKAKYYMYRALADLYIGGANYSQPFKYLPLTSKEEARQLSSDDSVKSIPDIGYITFFLRS